MGTCRRGLKAPLPPPQEGSSESESRPEPPLLPSRDDTGMLGTPPREAFNEGTHKCGLEAPPPPPPESPSKGKHGPQRAP
jgi:hypothetical protein